MKTKRFLSFITAAVLLCTAVVLGACNDSGETSLPAEMEYKVNVKDALGKTQSAGVIVKFLKNGEQVAMETCGENGTVTKTLATGEYDIELAFTAGADAFYYEAGKVTPEKTEIDIVVSAKITSEPHKIIVNENEYDMCSISDGCTYVELSVENRNYYSFAPQKAGKYKFSVINGNGATIGYYGAPHFIQTNNIAEMTDGYFYINVKDSMIGSGDTGTATYVIGVDTEAAKNCIIAIERVGDPDRTVEDEPWTVYKTTAELTEYDLPEGYELKEFDLTAPTDTYNLVFNEADGFYHLNSVDGPLVLVRLDEDCDYIACFGTMLEKSGVSKYFYDENGNFVKKESYSECLNEYLDYVDLVEGVYPMTEDLKYIIQQRGEYVGWWNPESSSYIFKDMNGVNLTDINNEIAWLLMSCYIE